MSSQLVKGLVFHYTTAQLAEQMRGRAAYHEKRAEEKSRALPDLKKAVETMKNTPEFESVTTMTKFGNASNYAFQASDQIENLEQDIADHKNKALVFRTLSDHLVPNATYELDEAALRRLEIVKQ